MCLSDLEFGFLIDRKGRRIPHTAILEWKGNPFQFVHRPPYVLGVDHSFIEVWHAETLHFVHLLPILCSALFSTTPELIGLTLSTEYSSTGSLGSTPHPSSGHTATPDLFTLMPIQ